MSETTYKFLIANRKTKDSERAVLPTITFASKTEVVGVKKIEVSALMVGWWAWGVGIRKTKVRKI